MSTTEHLNAALADRYVVERLIGEGGMATVYLARDLKHNRKVALKVLKPDLGAVVGVERFLSEIQVTANLQHPNLLPLFDSGASGDLLYYVMPLVDGESLRARLDREKQLPVDDALHIATAVASALDYAHRHGVIHRDLKPENILLHEGEPLVADFGIALALTNAGGNRITQTGISLGTPAYMSPEQATGDRVIDARSDIYSLGAVTYEMLTGESPHVGSTSQAIIARLLTEKPRPVSASRPSVPMQVEAAVDRALEKLPADRWATAKEFSEALTGVRPVTTSARMSMSSGPIAARGVTPRRVGARERVGWGVAVLAIATSVWLAVMGNRAPRQLSPVEFQLQLPDSHIVAARAGYNLALARDGRTLVVDLQLPSGGDTKLYVRRLEDLSVQPIKGTENGLSPALSPDGSEVLFTVGGALKRVSLQGGTPPTVVDSAATNGQASWGDAHQVVYGFRNKLWIVSEDGGPPRVLAAPDSSRHQAGYGWPEMLDGGKAALITIWKGQVTLDSATIGVVSIPDGTVTELGLRGTNPRYSATGHLLYATRDNILLAVPFSARSLRVTGVPTQVAEGVSVGVGGPGAFAIAQNGTLAYLGGGSTPDDLALVAVSRTGVERPLSAKLGGYGWPRVSPDGRRVALTVTGGGSGGTDIWVLDLKSSVLTRFTTDSASERPAWSPDGERIAYVNSRGDTVVWSRALYKTADVTPLVHAPLNIFEIAMGRPHGSSAVEVAGGVNGSYDVYIAPMDSLARARPLLNAPYNERMPQISPDGRLLAFIADESGHYEVYVRPLVGDGPTVQVSTDGGWEPAWGRAVDSRELFYRGPTHVMLAHLTDQPRLDIARRDTLFRDLYVRSNAHTAYDVFPGDKEIVMVRGAGASLSRPLIVVTHWSPGQRSAPQGGAGQ